MMRESELELDDWLAVRDDVAEFDSVSDCVCDLVAAFDVDAVAVVETVVELLSTESGSDFVSASLKVK